MNSFLIVRLGSLGDVVHAVPFAAALRRAFPRARLDWVTDPRYATFVGLVSGVDRVVPFDPRDAWRAPARFFGTLAGLRRARYDFVFDLQGLLKSAVVARAIGARRAIGFARGHLREPLAGLFYTDAVDPAGASHVIDKNLALLDAAGVRDRRVEFPLAVPSSRLVESVAARFAPGGFALINPGAAWPNKRWPAARFGAVASAVRDAHGLDSLVLWGPGERDLAQEVVDASGGAAGLAPPTAIPELADLARAARVMISGDTGPIHVAGAVGTPLVALFGPTRPERNGPWHARDVTISRLDGCDCVYERRCRRAEPCINDIAVDEVVSAVARRLGAHG